MLKDWNRCKIVKNEVFHFKNSLRPFVNVDNTSGDFCFLDLNEMKVYTFDDLDYEGLYFYTIEEDDDFMGVEIAGNIKEWF